MKRQDHFITIDGHENGIFRVHQGRKNGVFHPVENDNRSESAYYQTDLKSVCQR